jgi:EmrB/QacA subfamily drug resistance transporter
LQEEVPARRQRGHDLILPDHRPLSRRRIAGVLAVRRATPQAAAVPTPADDPIRTGTAQARGLLAAVIIGSGVAFLDATVVTVALPTIGTTLDASFAQLQWVVTGYTLTLASFILLGGSLGDRLGRRRISLLGLVGFAVTSVLCAAAPTATALIVARVLQGVAGALLTPGSLAIVQASFHPEDRGRAIGTWAGLTSLAPALGTLLGGWLTGFDWRLVFVINVPLAALAILLTLRYVPESRDETSTGPLDWVGATLAVVALAGITLALTTSASQAALAAGVTGLLAGAGFVAWEWRTPSPMVPLSLFAERTFSLANAYTLLVYATLSAMFFFLTLQLQTTLGFSPLAAGAASLPSILLLATLSGRAGALGARTGPRLPLTLGALLAAAGVAWLAAIDADADVATEVVPGVVVFGVGLTLLVAPLTTTVLAAAPDRLAGTASGVNNAVSRTGGLLSVAALPPLVGLAAQDYADPVALTAGYRPAMLACAVLLLIAAMLGTFLPGRPVRTA